MTVGIGVVTPFGLARKLGLEHGLPYQPGVALLTDSRITYSLRAPRDDGAKLWFLEPGITVAIAGRITLLDPLLAAAKEEYLASVETSPWDLGALCALLQHWLRKIPESDRSGDDRTQLLLGAGLAQGAALIRFDSASNFEAFSTVDEESIGDDAFAAEVWAKVREDRNIAGVGELPENRQSQQLGFDPMTVATSVGAALYSLGEAVPQGAVGGPVQACSMQNGETTLIELLRISLETLTYVDTVTADPWHVTTLTENDQIRRPAKDWVEMRGKDSAEPTADHPEQ